MTVLLEHVVYGMLILIGALIIADAAIRITASKDARRERRFRPGAEEAVGEFLAESPAEPTADSPGERIVLLKVATEALGDLTGTEHARLAGLLDRLGYVTQASEGLRARRRVVRRRAAETLSVIATPGTVPALTAALGDSDPIVRCVCARALAEIGGEDIYAAAGAVAARDIGSAPGPAAAVVLALGTHQPEALAPLLREDADPRIRAIAVTVVGELRLAQLAPLLQGCLGGGDDIAERAAHGLGSIGDITAVAALLGLASDELRGAHVRAAAVTALGSIGESSAVPAMEKLLRSDEWLVRHAAAMALPGLGEAGLEALRHAADSPLIQVREQAEAAMQR